MGEETAPPEVKTRKAAAKPLTAADRAMLLELFKRADLRREGGKLDIPMIVTLTGFTYNQITKVAGKDPYWVAQKAAVNPDTVATTETDLIDPPVAPSDGVVMSKEDFDRFKALLQQDKKLRTGKWDQLGLDPALAERARKLCQTGRAPMLALMEATQGGLVKTILRLDQINEEVGEKISKHLFPKEQDADGHEVEDGKKMREWIQTFVTTGRLQMDLNSSLQKNQAIMAKMLLDMKKLGDGSKPPEKGVYQMQPDSNHNGTTPES